VPEITLLDTRGLPADHGRHAGTAPSRVADNFFWLGRQAERLEDATRLLRTVLSRLGGEGGQAEEAELNALVRCFVILEKFPPRFNERISRSELTAALRRLVFDEKTAGSIRHFLRRTGFLTASLRDRFSGDTWRILHQLQSEFPSPPLHFVPNAVLATLHRLIAQLAAFSGMEMENMTRGHAWRFLEIGRRIERASNIAQTLQAVLACDGLPAILVPLLEYSDSTMTYRRRYYARPELPSTLALLLPDAANPRSFAFQLAALERLFAELPGAADDPPEQRKFADLQATLRAADLPVFAAAAEAGDSAGLAHLLDELTSGCWAVSDLLTDHYFSHTLPRLS
jgi:uncharacterized alpha-E superfamily protein